MMPKQNPGACACCQIPCDEFLYWNSIDYPQNLFLAVEGGCLDGLVLGPIPFSHVGATWGFSRAAIWQDSDFDASIPECDFFNQAIVSIALGKSSTTGECVWAIDYFELYKSSLPYGSIFIFNSLPNPPLALELPVNLSCTGFVYEADGPWSTTPIACGCVPCQNLDGDPHVPPAECAPQLTLRVFE